MDEHLTWPDHVTALVSPCHSALAVLRKLRNLAPYHVRKQLAESLVTSKLDYGCIAYYALPEYQMKRLQRVQTTCAGNVLGRYAVLGDLRKLNWLPIIKRRDMALLKITHKALYDDVWPDYLRHKFHTVSAYNSRSLEARKLAIPDYNKFVRLAMKLMFSEGESVWLIFTCTYFFKKHSVLFLNLLYISFLI